MTGDKFDDGKLELCLIPWRAAEWFIPEPPQPVSLAFKTLLAWYQGESEDGLLESLNVILETEPDALESAVRALVFGRGKYSEFNWQTVAGAKQRYTNAALRHVLKHLQGKERDEETKQSHLAHATCNLIFLKHFEVVGVWP